MIIYGTKQTMERYGLSDELHTESNIVPIQIGQEQGNPLHEWGAKIFYFERKKCLQVCNFASKFSLFLFNLKKNDIDLIGELMAFYIYEMYSEDKDMQSALVELLGLRPAVCFSKLTDRRIIASLNAAQRMFAGDGDYFYQFMYDDVLDTFEINYRYNFEYFVTDKIDGKTQYYFPGERFRELVLAPD